MSILFISLVYTEKQSIKSNDLNNVNFDLLLESFYGRSPQDPNYRRT